MKQFKTKALTLAVAGLLSSSFSAAAMADSYTFTVLPETHSQVRASFPRNINDSGLITLHGRFSANTEIDFDLMTDNLKGYIGLDEDFDPATDSLTEAQYWGLVQVLADRENANSAELRIATDFAGTYNGQDILFHGLLNGTDGAVSSQEKSADHAFLGLNNNNVRVGWASAPYTRFDHTYQPEPAEEGGEMPDPITLNFAEREYISRGLWFDGTNYSLIAPPEQEYLGGEAQIFAINDTNLAVGNASVALFPAAQERVDACIEDFTPASNRAVYTCIWNLWYGFQREAALGGSFTANGSLYDMHAAVWQLDDQGQVISETLYPPLRERSEDDGAYWSAYAYAVNNNGIAVGQSWTYYNDVEQPGNRIKMPVVYQNGETKAITTDEEYIWGSATAINDEDQATGFVIRTIQGVRRAIGFIYDVEAETFAELPGFFEGSSTYPNAINNQGLVVGSGEIDYTLNAERRRVGFVYDLNNPDAGFINLNDAIGCSADYYIVSADDINEDNQILATALTTIEETTEEGETYTRNVYATLKLDTAAGEVTGCSTEDEIITREGAATSPFGLIAMFLIGGLITIRRLIKV